MSCDKEGHDYQMVMKKGWFGSESPKPFRDHSEEISTEICAGTAFITSIPIRNKMFCTKCGKIKYTDSYYV